MSASIPKPVNPPRPNPYIELREMRKKTKPYMSKLILPSFNNFMDKIFLNFDEDYKIDLVKLYFSILEFNIELLDNLTGYIKD